MLSFNSDSQKPSYNKGNLVTRHLIHNGIEYKITHVGTDFDYVQCSEVGSASNEVLRLPIDTAIAKLKDRTDFH